MRFNITLTWDEWWPLWARYPAEQYHTVGIGPFYLEFFWGSGLAPWEQ